MSAANPFQTISAASGVSNGAVADLTGGSANNLLAHHIAVVTVSGWSDTDSPDTYPPAYITVVLQASLDNSTWVTIAQNDFKQAGVFTLKADYVPARYLRVAVTAVSAGVTGFTCSAYVGGSA